MSDSDVEFLMEAARYFRKQRNVGGEDKAFWASISNAENCERIAKRLNGEQDATARLVANFSTALLEKLRESEAKYSWQDSWMRKGWSDDLRRHIRDHVDKGDPRDVAAYCAFAWYHGWSLAEPGEAA